MLADATGLLACPACASSMERDRGRVRCTSCGTSLPVVDGWCVDAVGDEAGFGREKRARARGYRRPVAAAAYDLDVTVTSAAIWGAPLRHQVGFNRRALEAAAAAGSAYLDVPAGTGLVLSRALDGLRPPPVLVVADLSMAMLARARRRLGDRAAYVRADVERLPFASHAFGAVHSGNGLHVFPDTGRAVAEIRRVSAEGAVAFFTTWVERGRPVAELYMSLLRRVGAINAPAPVAYYEDLLRGAGFDAVGVDVEGSLLEWRGVAAR